MRAFVLLQTKTGRETYIKGKLEKIKQIKSVHILTGSFDLLVIIEVENERELRTITIDRIRRMESVLETTTLIELP